MKLRIVIGIGFAVIIFALAAWQLKGRDSEPGMITAKAEHRTINATVLATGSVQAIVGAEVRIGARISGVVQRLPVRVGSVVREGQLIGKLDDRELSAQVDQAMASLSAARARLGELETGYSAEVVQSRTDIERAQADLHSAKSRLEQAKTLRSTIPAEVRSQIDQAAANLDQAKAAQENARVRFERMTNLLEQDFIARQDVDNAKTEYDVAQSRVKHAAAILEGARISAAQTEIRSEDVTQALEAVTRAESSLKQARADAVRDRVREQAIQTARAQVRQSEASLRSAETKLSYTNIISPINGVVASVSTQEGETVSAGLQTQTFVTIIDLSRLEVRALVDETDIGSLRVGYKAYFTVDSYPDKEFTGVVTAIYPKAVMDQNVVNYDVVINIDEFPDLLRPDMTANVTINIDTRDNVLVAPNKAIKRQDGERVVYLMVDGAPSPRAVKTGWKDSAYTEILSGLNEGDEILLGDLPR